MALKYYLVDNEVTPDPHDRKARSIPHRKYTLEDAIAEMISSGSTVTRAEALSVLEEFSRVVERIVDEGSSLTTPLFTVSSKVIGPFKRGEDLFNKEHHKVQVKMVTGKRLREAGKKIKVKKVARQMKTPLLVYFVDHASGLKDQIVTPGGAAQIEGKNLKCDMGDPRQGIFFINDSRRETRVKPDLLMNKPGGLIFTIPKLGKGIYTLEVRTILRNSSAVRRGRLSCSLTCEG